MGWIVSGVSHGVSGSVSFRLDLWFEPARVIDALLAEEPSSSDTRLGSRGLLGRARRPPRSAVASIADISKWVM